MRFGGLFHGFSFGAGFELMRRVVVPVVLALCILGLWWWLGPEKPSCDSARQHVARSAVEHAVTRIRAEQGDARRAAVLHLANDPTDFVTLTLRRRLMEGGWLDLDGTPPLEKVRNLLNFRNPSVYDVEKAREYGKENGLDAVIIGNLDQFETTNNSAVLKGLLKFVRIAKGDVVNIHPALLPKHGGKGGEARACAARRRQILAHHARMPARAVRGGLPHRCIPVPQEGDEQGFQHRRRLGVDRASGAGRDRDTRLSGGERFVLLASSVSRSAGGVVRV